MKSWREGGILSTRAILWVTRGRNVNWRLRGGSLINWIVLNGERHPGHARDRCASTSYFASFYFTHMVRCNRNTFYFYFLLEILFVTRWRKAKEKEREEGKINICNEKIMEIYKMLRNC